MLSVTVVAKEGRMKPLHRLNSEIQTNSLSKEIVEVVSELQMKLSTWDLNFVGYTPRSLVKFLQLPNPVQGQIIQALQFALQIVNSAPEALPFRSLDAYMLEKACMSLNIRVPEEFVKLIKKGDVVEIYETETQTQIYRNFEFLRHSSYDLLTVCTTPYPELFEREKGFEEVLVQRIKEVAFEADGVESWEIAPHYLVERLESHQNKFKLHLGYVAPVFHAVTGQRIAWVSTIQVENLGSSYKGCSNVVPL